MNQKVEKNEEKITNNGNISDLEFYKIIRDYITHEDSLINNRLTWLLAIQGLLFTAYGLSIREPIHPENTDLKSLILLLKILGISTSGFCFTGILAAVLAIYKLKDKWEIYNKERQFPAVTGGGNSFSTVIGGQTPLAIPIIFFMVWFSLLDLRQNCGSIIVFVVVMVLYLVIAAFPIWVNKTNLGK